MPLIVGAGAGALTVKLKGADCLPSGFLTRMLHVPGAFRTATIGNELDDTAPMSVPLSVDATPAGEVSVTVSADWNPLPVTVRCWEDVLDVGVLGEMAVIAGAGDAG